MAANQNEIYLFAIPGGTLLVSFEDEGVLSIAVTAGTDGVRDTEHGGLGEAENQSTASFLHGSDVRETAWTLPAKVDSPRERVTVLVEESVVSFAAFSLRVVVWKYPLSVQVLTESGEWLLRVQSIEIGRPGTEPVIRVTAERSPGDELKVTQATESILGTDATPATESIPGRDAIQATPAIESFRHTNATEANESLHDINATQAECLIYHRREHSEYALRFDGPGPYAVDVDSRLDAYTFEAHGQELRLCLLFGPALRAVERS